MGSKEYREKMSSIAKNKGYGRWLKGRKLSEETKKKMSEVAKRKGFGKWMIGRTPHEDFLKRQQKGLITGEKHASWRGDKVSYAGLHMWIKKVLGSPPACVYCNFSSTNNRKIHWANKSGDYKRQVDDWIRLCVPCHSAYDKGKIQLNGIH